MNGIADSSCDLDTNYSVLLTLSQLRYPKGDYWCYSVTSFFGFFCYVRRIDNFLRPKRTRLMSKPKVTTDTVKVSRLGCMRKSTVVKTDDDKTVEHVEVWVPADKDKKKEKTPL